MTIRKYKRGEINPSAKKVSLIDYDGIASSVLIITKIDFDPDTVTSDGSPEKRMMIGPVKLETSETERTLFGYVVKDLKGNLIPNQLREVCLI